MELDAGTQLGPYEIQRKVGAGGMGVVYRATDSRLGRNVAIKVLPASMREDVDRMRRFEREARTIGGLNHPNLVTLHDVGTHEGTPFLVTELLDGLSLRQRMQEGRIPPREAVRIAGEIARGLAAAHGASITHRDIKPENIFVMADDRVKVLDFGIAKLAEKAEDEASGNAATLAGVGNVGGTAHTGTGMVVGTPGYMAPEQLGGADVDARTDIFALGVVLYEMLAGRRPFASDSGISVEESYAILKNAPPDLPTSVPPQIARVVRRCLEKKPAARFQSASDLAFALEATANPSDSQPIRAQEAVAETLAQAAISADDLEPARTGTTDLGVAPVVVPTTGPIAAIRARLASTPGTPTDAVTGRGIPRVIEDGDTQPVRGRPKATPALIPEARTPWKWIAATAGVVSIGAVIVAMLVRPTAKPGAVWPQLVEGGAAYHRVTFLPQPASFAKFTSDEHFVLWSERRGENWYVIQSSLGAPSMTQTSLIGRVLDVSREDGQVAIRTYGEGEGGTLKRGVSGNGAPETVTIHVEDAAFSSDGSKFAIVRTSTETVYTLEYPIDKTIYKPSSKGGSLRFPSVARGGSAVAVVEIDASPQTSGRIVVIKPDGSLITKSATYDHIDGIDWSPDDSEVWFAEGSTIRALKLDGGTDRVLHRAALPIKLRDVAKDGRMLVAPTTLRARTILESLKDKTRKNVGWFDGSEVRGISRDGSTIVFLESTAVVHDESGYPAFRRVGDEPPASLGKARNLALFPDGIQTLVITGPASSPRIVSEGKANIELPLGPIEKLDVGDAPAIAWSGRYVVVRGAAKDGPMRLWRYDLEAKGSAPTPVGPDKVREGLHPISADGAMIAIPDRGKGIQIYSTVGLPMKVIGTGEIVPISFDETGTAMFTMALHNYPRKILRVELATQEETELQTIAPDDKPDRLSVVIDASGDSMAYSTIAELAELYVIEPPKP